jgi:hypothetical protein
MALFNPLRPLRVRRIPVAPYLKHIFTVPECKSPTILFGALLPDLDSNQDKQSQSLSYYRYTIRQYAVKELISFIFGCKDNLES